MIPLNVVVIGRNEEANIKRCLMSALKKAHCVVYVDSGSDDRSVELAKEMGVFVLELDPGSPFTAARGRNAGFEHLMTNAPEPQYVQFIDGDCELQEGWLEAAIFFLENSRKHAIVCGRLRERNPEASVYNRLCDMEWNGPIGDIGSCGGIFMIRTEAYAEVEGMNSTLAAGEEPEMCLRLRRKGWLIARINQEMAWHQAGITNFIQWWNRSVRSGKGAFTVFRGTSGQVFAPQVRSAFMWTVGWSGVLICAIGMSFLLGRPVSLILAFLVASLYPVQMLRIGLRGRHNGLGVVDAFTYGWLMLVTKWAELYGLCSAFLSLGKIQQKSVNNEMQNSEHRSDWQADKKRYPERPWLKEQSIWAVAVYRFGQWGDARQSKVQRWVYDRIYWLLFRIVETLTGISITKAVVIGPGLRIWHFGNIVIHPDVRIGAGCTLRQGVTIGNRIENGPVPVIGDRVEFGAYAQVFGDVAVGEGAKIGAMSVVLIDVPPNTTAVGVPAKIVFKS